MQSKNNTCHKKWSSENQTSLTASTAPGFDSYFKMVDDKKNNNTEHKSDISTKTHFGGFLVSLMTVSKPLLARVPRL